MRLLSLDQINQRTSKERDAKVIAGANLAADVDRLRLIVNGLKDEKQKVLQELAIEQEKQLREFEQKMQAIESQVKELEDKKKDAMKPVDALLAEATRLKKEQETKLQDLQKKESVIDKAKEQITEQLEKLDDLRDSLNVQSSDLTKREKSVQVQEAWARTSAEKLTDEWRKYAETMGESKRLLDEKEQRLSAQEQSISVREKEQEKEKKALALDREHLFLQQRAFKMAIDEYNGKIPSTIWQQK